MIRRMLVGALLVFVLGTLAIVGLGWKPYVVMSNSMAPAMHTSDLVLVDPHPKGVAKNEIVTYESDQGLVTHRIVRLGRDGTYTLKGDANRQVDARPVALQHVIGPVRLIVPNLGWPVVQVRTHPVKVAGVTILLALLWPRRRRLLRLALLGALVVAVAMVPTTGATSTAGTATPPAPAMSPAPPHRAPPR